MLIMQIHLALKEWDIFVDHNDIFDKQATYMISMITIESWFED